MLVDRKSALVSEWSRNDKWNSIMEIYEDDGLFVIRTDIGVSRFLKPLQRPETYKFYEKGHIHE